MRSILVVLCAYLIGSIPFGYLIVRLRHGADIRETGSGGTGATNVTRRAGRLAGVLTLLLDGAKGIAAVLIAKSFGSAEDAAWIVGVAAIAALVGHIFPIWLKFRGGKGVATGLGVMAVLAPIPTLVAMVAFVITFMLTRYVSLSSMVAAMVLPIAVFSYHGLIRPSDDPGTLLAALIGAVLIVWAHRANIDRLRTGTETKFR